MTYQSTRFEFTSLLDNQHGDIRFMLDDSVFLQEGSDNLEIVGWAIHRKHKILEVLLTTDTGVLATSKIDIFRPKVNEHFKKFYNAESAGFKLTLATPPNEKTFLKIALSNGETVPIAELVLVKINQPKLLFMHIAKAAGSTVNTFFANHYPKDRHAVHIESNKKWHTSPNELKRLHFLSGHIHLYALEKRLNLDDYYKVTLVREPYAQLRSHLSWIRRLSDPGEENRLKQHENYIQKFSGKLSKVDFTNPEKLKDCLESLEDLEMRLVDNCQVRYFTAVPAGNAVGNGHPIKAIEASAKFDLIGTTEHTAAFLKNVAIHMSWPEPESFRRENVTQQFYGLDTTNKDIRKALKPLVQHDIVLYNHMLGIHPVYTG